jgi:hypothetical protein
VPLLTVNGHRASPWGVLARMHELEFVRQFQLVQQAADALLVRIIGRPGHRCDEAALRRLITEELGDGLRVEIEHVGALERLSSGKAPPAVAAPTYPQPDPRPSPSPAPGTLS